MREKLIELLGQDVCPMLCTAKECPYWKHENCCDEKLADHLIANGVRVQKRGRWENERCLVGGFNNIWGYDCSECGKTVRDEKTNYCPNCGADMRGEEHER